jgi:membrane fusion protein (multidrug efflux system)
VIEEGAVPQGILVPQQGISLGPKGNASALLVGKDGKVESRAVHVSRAIADQWLVEDGLAAGDRVIVEGVQKADPGTLVRALERAPGQPLAASANAPASAAVASR